MGGAAWGQKAGWRGEARASGHMRDEPSERVYGAFASNAWMRVEHETISALRRGESMGESQLRDRRVSGLTIR